MDKKILLICPMIVLSADLVAKDPTQPILPASISAATKTTLAKEPEQPLTAIFIKNSKRFAMIEGGIYQAGEYYRDNQIINIELDRVLLSSSQGKFYLTLIPNIKK